LLQDGRRRQAVVAGTDDDRVVISHGQKYVSTDIIWQGWDTIAGL